MTQLDLLAGRTLAQQGAQRAIDNAEAHHPGWAAEARGLVREYAERHPYFLAEDVRAWSHGRRGLALPPDGRSWGGVMLAAIRDGWVERAGYEPMKSPNSHAAPKSLWRSTLFKPQYEPADAPDTE
jgi:hypothetical protein